MHSLWSWNRLYLGEEISSLIGFRVFSLKMRGGEVSLAPLFFLVGYILPICERIEEKNTFLIEWMYYIV